jgi:hypothetical protein
MAGTRITSFPILPSGDLALDDVFLVVDVSDTYYSPSGTNKQTTLLDIVNSEAALNKFTELTDTPVSLGAAGQVVTVAADGNNLVFSSVTASGLGAATSFVELTDTVGSLGSEGQVVVVSGGNLTFSGLSEYITTSQTGDFITTSQTGAFGGASAFTDLTDTTGALGTAGQSVVVSADGSSLVFSGVSGVGAGGGGTSDVATFTDLTDTAGALGTAGQSVVVSSDGNSLIFSGVSGAGGGGTSDVTAFTGLTDTVSYLGTEGQVPVMSGGVLAFSGITLTSTSETVLSGSLTGFTELGDTPSGLGSPLQSVVVSADGSSLIFSGITGSSGGGTIIVTGATTSVSGILGNDLFTGDGIKTGFMMSRAPINAFSITVAVNGLSQAPGTNYDLTSGNSGITFPEAPSSGIEIDVRHLGGLVGPSGVQGPVGPGTGVQGTLASDLFTGDGATTDFDLSSSIDYPRNTIVSINGLLQSPVTNYTISGSGLTFPEAPSSGLEVEVRLLAGLEGPSGAPGVDGTGAADLSAIDQHVLPDTTNTYDLGSTGKRWRDLYLTGTSIYLGQQVLKESGANVSLSKDNGSTFSRLLTDDEASTTYTTVASSTNAAVYDFNSSANFNNTSASFSDGALNPSTGDRLELDLATGMFIETYSNENSIDTTNSSGYLVDGKAKIEQVLNTGNGSDGDVEVPSSVTYNINTGILISSRTVADAIAFNADSFTTNTVVLTDTPSGIAAGDEVVIYCAQGYGSYTYNGGQAAPSSRRGNVGNYEFLTVDSVDSGTKTITFTSAKEKYYGNVASLDSTVGIGGSEMKVVVQRVPNYENLTLNESSTLTCSNWDGYKGGLVFFRVGSTLINNGYIDAAGKGYRGGPGGGFTTYSATGESIMGGPFSTTSSSTSSRNDGGAGNPTGSEAGSGQHHGNDHVRQSAGEKALNYIAGLGLMDSLTDFDRLFFGSGGGGAGGGGAGGAGGGIVFFHANAYSQLGSGNVRSNYQNGGRVGYTPYFQPVGGGYGAGGEIQIFANSVSLTSNSFSVVGASYVNNGASHTSSSGRFKMTYVSLSGSIYSGTYFYSGQIAGAYSSSAIIQSTNILSSAGQVDSINRLLTTVSSLPAGSQALVQFAQGTGTGYYWQDATGGSGLSTSLSVGTDTDTDLSSLSWSGTNFYYRLTLTGNGSITPEIDVLKLDYDPDLYIGTEQTWTSQALGDGIKRVTPTSFVAYWTDDSDSVKPKYQLIGSNTSDFASTSVYPGVSAYYQDGGTFDINNGESFALTTAITQYNKYWKIKVYISSGPTTTDAPVVDRIKLNVNLVSDFETKGVAQAWVNFIGVTGGNATITDSLNVSSINRISTGVYNVNFSENFSDVNYMLAIGGYQNDGGWPVAPVRDLTGTISVSGYQIAIASGQTRIDSTGEGVCLSFLGS